MNNRIDPSNTLLPKFVIFTNKILLFFASTVFITVFSLTIPIGAYILDVIHQEIDFVLKSGSLLTILGLLLTIKYRFLKDSKTFQDYFDSIIGAGCFTESTISIEEKERVESIAIKESLGFWLIIFGTLLNIFGDHIPLISLCK